MEQGNTAVAPLALSRSLASRHVTMISMGGMIGAGVFVGSSAAIAAVGPAIVFSYLMAGVLILLVMRMLAEMATALPGVRSFTEFARAGLGPAAGFVAGWLYWYFWIIVVPVEAIAGAGLLHAWIALPSWLLGAALIAIMTGVNLMSARSFGEFEFWFASIKVAAIIIFIALSLSYACGLLHASGPTWSNLVSHGGFMPRGPLAVLAGVTTVFFSLTGAEITTVAAAESRDPVRALTTMTTSVTTRIVIFYVGSILLIVAVAPWDSIVPGQSPFTHALLHMGFDWAGDAMSLVILTAVLSCLNSAFYVTSRVLFALAERGDAPQWIVRLNARQVPARSVLAGSAAGLLGIAAATWSPSGVFAFLVNASGALILFVYMLTALAQIRLRRGIDPATLAFKVWWFPWSSYAVIAAIIAVLAAMALTDALASQFYVSIAALVVVLCAYGLLRRQRRLGGQRTQSTPDTPDTNTASAADPGLLSPERLPEGGAAAAAARSATFSALQELALGPAAGGPSASQDESIRRAIEARLAHIIEEPHYAPRRPLLLPRLMQAVENDAVSQREIVRILSGDPALAGSLLRLANSPYYRQGEAPIESLDRAVAMLGAQGMRSAISAALLQPIFRISSTAFADFGEISWEHAFYAGMAAEAHAAIIENSDPFAAQLLALLMGLSDIVVFRVAQDEFNAQQRAPEAASIALLIEAYRVPVARQIAAHWGLSERIDTALAQQTPPAEPASALGRSLQFGRYLGALAVLRERGAIDPASIQNALRSGAAATRNQSGINPYERIWARMVVDPASASA